MTNIDLQIRLQNQAVLTRIEALTQHTRNVKLNVQATGLRAFRTTIRDYLEQHPIQVSLSVNQRSLRALSRNIGTIPINLNIANSPQILAQIQQLVSSAGGGVINPAAARTARSKNPVSSSALLREHARRLRAGVESAEDAGYIPSGTIGRSIGGAQSLSVGRGVKNVKSRNDLLAVQQAEQAVAKRESKLQSLQEQFEQENRFDRLVKGRNRSARDFEVKKGLNPGSINTNFNDRALDFNRLKDPKAFNELAFAGLFGGTTGLVGGALGGATLGRPGVFLGSAAAQVAVKSITETFTTITGILGEVAKAGLELQQSLQGLSTAFLTTGKFINNKTGQPLGIGDSITAANARSRQLLANTAPQLSSIGIPLGTTALALRRSQTALGERGISLNDRQLSRLNQVVLARAAAFDPELLEQPQKLGTGIENIFGAAANAKTGELAQVLGVQNVERITKSIKTGDVQGLTDAIESLGGAFEFLSKNAEFAVLPLRRLISTFEQMRQTAGDRFLQAITPAFNAFVNVLAKPETVQSFNLLADSAGRFAAGILEMSTGLLQLANDMPIVTSQIVQALGAGIVSTLIGGLGGAALGFLTAGPAGAVAGGLLGSRIGLGAGLAGGAIGGGLDAVTGLNRQARENLNPQVNAEGIKDRTFRQQRINLIQAVGRGELTGTQASAILAKIPRASDVTLEGNKRPFDADEFNKKELKTVDEGTFSGRKRALDISLGLKVSKGEKDPFFAVKELKRGERGLGVEELQERDKVAKTFRELPDILETNKLKFGELNAALVTTTESLNALDKQTQINRLEGEDKVVALIQQQAEKGGVLSREQADLLNKKFPGRAGSLLNEGILGSPLNAEQRERAQAGLQLDTFLQRFNPENDAAQERAKLLKGQLDAKGQLRELKFDDIDAQTNAAIQVTQLRDKLDIRDPRPGGDRSINPADANLFGLADKADAYLKDRQSGKDSSFAMTDFIETLKQVQQSLPSPSANSSNQSQNEVFQSMVGHLAAISANTAAIVKNTAPLATLGSN